MGDFTLRAAAPEDHPGFARLFPELAVDDPIPSPEKWANEMAPQSFVADRDGEIVGYVFGQALDGLGYVRNVAVSPAARGLGIGKALMLRFAQLLRERGIREWHLNVKPENTPATSLYQALGMRRQYGSVSLRFDWELVATLPEADFDVEAFGPEDHAALETATGMQPGVLDAVAKIGGRVMLAAWRQGAARGFAAFDPAFPGAYPFRVADPDAAGPIWRALRHHARHPYSQIVIEDDPVTRERFTSRGATVRMEIDHYVGPVPGWREG